MDRIESPAPGAAPPSLAGVSSLFAASSRAASSLALALALAPAWGRRGVLLGARVGAHVGALRLVLGIVGLLASGLTQGCATVLLWSGSSGDDARRAVDEVVALGERGGESHAVVRLADGALRTYAVDGAGAFYEASGDRRAKLREGLGRDDVVVMTTEPWGGDLSDGGLIVVAQDGRVLPEDRLVIEEAQLLGEGAVRVRIERHDAYSLTVWFEGPEPDAAPRGVNVLGPRRVSRELARGAGRVLVTPLALAIDAATLPIQAGVIVFFASKPSFGGGWAMGGC